MPGPDINIVVPRDPWIRVVLDGKVIHDPTASTPRLWPKEDIDARNS